jgi:hypothetical protein
MAFGNERQGGGGKDTFVRLSGVFPTAKGNLIGRIEATAFNTIYQMMQDAASREGTLNIIISKNKNTGKPEMYGVVGEKFVKQGGAPTQPIGPFGQFQPAAAVPAPAAVTAPTAPFATATREVTFGQVDVPKDDFDKLLESL